MYNTFCHTYDTTTSILQALVDYRTPNYGCANIFEDRCANIFEDRVVVTLSLNVLNLQKLHTLHHLDA